MRIVICMQGAQTESRFRGIGRYTLSFAEAIVRNRGEHEVILALNGLFPDTIEPIRAVFDGLLPKENIRVWYAPGPIREAESANVRRRVVAELIRETFLASLHPDVIHISSLFEGYIDDAVTSIGLLDQDTPVSVSLYDLIPLLNRDQYLSSNPSYKAYYERKVGYLLRASLMLAISEFSRQEGLEYLDVAPDSVVNVSTAIDDRFNGHVVSALDAASFKERYNITGSFIFCAGGADERKNLPRLIQAYAGLTPALRARHRLVLAGKISEGDLIGLGQLVKKVGLTEDEVRFIGYVTDDQLIAFYKNCTVFVFPSWHEGFGLPALEAMACGAAVIGSNVTSLPEVIGRLDALFDPLDTDEITAKIKHVLEDDSYRNDLRTHGLIQAKTFSWDETGRRAIAAFEKLHKSHCKYGDSAESMLRKLIQKISQLAASDMTQFELKEIAYAIDRSLPSSRPQPRQLLVDISELIQRDARTGVQRVTRSILHQLLISPPAGYIVEPVYALINQPGYRYARKFKSELGVEVAGSDDDAISIRPGDIFLGLDLQHQTTRQQQQFLSEIRNSGVSVFFVIYDLLPIQFPNYWKGGLSELHRNWLYTVCGFDGVICISRAVADELKIWLKENGPPRIRPLSIKWFHLGADVDKSMPSMGLPENAPDMLRAFGSRPTFLSVGTIEPRKGQAQTLSAFELLWQSGEDVNIVFVGKQGWMVEALAKEIRNHAQHGKHLFWLEGISDEYLEKIYAVSSCLIAASEGEGFGLPLIEAAQHKLPIIARDIPVFREVAGEHAFYFAGMKPCDLAYAVQNWLRLYTAGQHPSSEFLPWLTWHESALELMKSCISP